MTGHSIEQICDDSYMAIYIVKMVMKNSIWYVLENQFHCRSEMKSLEKTKF